MISLYENIFDRLCQLEVYENEDQIESLTRQLVNLVKDWMVSGKPIE